MSVLSKLKRDKTEFLIGQRLNRKRRKRHSKALKAENDRLAARCRPEAVDRSFATTVVREIREEI